MNRKSDLFYASLHVPVDALAVICAFIVSYFVRGEGLQIFGLPYESYLRLVYQSVPVWLIIFALQGLYAKRNLFGTLQTLLHLGISVLAGWASFVVFLVFLNREQMLVFPRLMLIYILIFSFIFVFWGRLILRFVQYVGRSLGFGRRRILVVGHGELAKAYASALERQQDPGIEYVRHLDSHDPDELEKAIQRYAIGEAVVADHSLSENRILELIIVAQNANVVCHYVPNMFDVQSTNVLFSTLAGMPLLTYRQTPLEGWGRIVKRMIDIVVSAVALVLLSPVFLVIGAIIKLTDPGPIFYPHERISRGGEKIRILKFRSMKLKYCTGDGFNPKSQVEIFREMNRPDLVEEWERDQKVKDDPRISRIGKILRKTSLDELPQLINVLKGELSLVGPRPITVEELKRYGRWGSYLLSIRPGITGLWQVSGRNDISYDERVRIDAHYVQNWSLWQDISIIIKTVLALASKRSGY